MYDWLRLYHSTVTDPKWRVVAARASHAMSRHVTVADVLAVWMAMLVCASQASPRGTLAGWSDEDVAVALMLDEALVTAIYAAMQGKVVDGNHLIAWEKRQPKREREDTTATDRKRAQRARDKAAADDCHATSRHVTHRQEEIREDKSTLGEGESTTSREAPTDAATTHAPDDEGGEAKAEAVSATTAGTVAKALRERGIAGVNPSHPKLLELIAAGVTLAEFTDAAQEVRGDGGRGKANLAYLCAVIVGRRRDAADMGGVPGKTASETERVNAKHAARYAKQQAAREATRAARARAGPAKPTAEFIALAKRLGVHPE